MTRHAHITTINGQPWLHITAPTGTGQWICTFDAPLDLSSKSTTRAEIDHAHARSGVSRPDLYDAVRAYKRGRT